MGNLIDLTGKKFGKWTVLHRTEKPEHVKAGNAYWLCQCECGTIKAISGSELTRGRTLSCGCGYKTHNTYPKVEEGQRYGKLTTLKLVEKPEHLKTPGKYWLCQCDCGKQTVVIQQSLKNGHTKSCGCLNYERRDKDSLIGQRFGKLQVIARSEPPEGVNDAGTFWLCKCDCGNEKIIMGKSLREGHTRSCGCLKKDIGAEKILGEKFGKLTVIKQSELRAPNGHIYYECLCDCGNIHYATAGNLHSGNINSCGCLVSKGEFNIKKLLVEYNIPYKAQVSFDDLRSKNNTPLRFDFGIYNNNQLEQLLYLIEFQGEQHYDSSDSFFPSPKYNDELKRKYCKEHNIKLLEIPYWHRNSLTIEKIIPDEYRGKFL